MTPIGGKVLFRDAVYANSDMCLRAAAGSLTLRWWPGRTREFGEAPSTDKPCRVAVQLTGLEVLWYNNVAAYERVARSVRSGSSVVEIPGKAMLSASRFRMPGLYKLSPAISLSISVGCVMLGTPDLPCVTVLSFHRARGVHWVGPPSSELDYYRRTTMLDVRLARLRLVRNVDWVPGREIVRKPVRPRDALAVLTRLRSECRCCLDPEGRVSDL
jgi:hypothetical protein